MERVKSATLRLPCHYLEKQAQEILTLRRRLLWIGGIGNARVSRAGVNGFCVPMLNSASG
jgi:hypothetical protein